MSYLKSRLAELAILVWVLVAPIHVAIGSVMALPMVDLFLALFVQYRQIKPQGIFGLLRMIESSGLKRTVAKVLVYEAATILAFVTEMLTGPTVPAIQMVTGLIGVTELKSCLEHLDELGGNKFFSSLFNKLAPPGPPSDPSNPNE
jgi:hypothetical protein